MDEHVIPSVTPLASPLAVVGSKFRQPIQRPGIVERTRVLQRVAAAQPWSVWLPPVDAVTRALEIGLLED